MTKCRQKRLALGLSQDKLASLANVRQPYISKIELQRSDVHPDDLKAVAGVLGLKPEELMETVTV
jgi:transcriptional regulator with XRE-family HTH domain